ncbi:MAG: DUF2062 domain-containing protein [Geminicoccaceae bacterium]
MYLLMRLTRLSGTPHSIACGFACGAAISFTPFVGLHIVLSVLAAWMLRGHIIAAAVGTVVGNPWTFPFIWLATYKAGQILLGSAEAAPWPAVTMFKHVVTDLGELIWPTLIGEDTWDALKQVLLDLRALIWPMLIGSIPLGLVAGFACYLPLAKAIETFQRARDNRRKKSAQQRTDSLTLTARAVDPKSCAS